VYSVGILLVAAHALVCRGPRLVRCAGERGWSSSDAALCLPFGGEPGIVSASLKAIGVVLTCYCGLKVVLGGGGPVPDRCAHQAGTSLSSSMYMLVD